MPSGWSEALVQVVYNTNFSDTTNNVIMNTYHLANEYYDTITQQVSLGQYGTSYAIGRMSKELFQLTRVVWGGAEDTSHTRTYVYYR